MFKKNDYIMYESMGVCQIQNIGCPDFEKDKEKIYYYLKPLHSPCDQIYVPVNNELKMRNILTKQEANELIDKIPEIAASWINDDTVREETYKEAIKSLDCYEWVRVIKSLYLKIDERRQDGKKPIQMDEKYMSMTEDYLHGELSAALEIPMDEVKQYISSKIQESGMGL